MKFTMVVTVGALISSLALGSENLQFKAFGQFSSCRSIDEEQLNEAQEALNKDASRCGPLRIPVQLDDTEFAEAAACIHYTRGQHAVAAFECQPVDTATFSQTVFLRLSNDEERNPRQSTYQHVLEIVRRVAKPICGKRQIVSASPLTLGHIDVKTTTDGGQPLGSIGAGRGEFRCQ